MRVTDRLQQQQLLSMVRSQLEQLHRVQQEAITGRRVNKLSDAPADAAQLLELQGQLRDVDRYRRNATEATTRLSAEDTVLQSATELLDRARQVALGGASELQDDTLRQGALQEARQILNELVALANTKLGGEYLFGGAQTGSPPFLPDGTYVGDDTVRQAEIESGHLVTVSHPGDEVFGDAVQALRDVITALDTGTADSVHAAAAELGAATEGVRGIQAIVGARSYEVKSTVDALGSRAAVLLDARDRLREVDTAEAMVAFTVMQSALERSYAVIGRVLSVSLTDFLR